jgi:tetratricopeptide (TPR) repeat protein
MNSAGVLYMNQRRHEEADELWSELLDLLRREKGNDHPQTLSALWGLAHTRVRAGKLAEAEPLCLELVETRRRILGTSHHSTLAALRLLAALHRKQGRFRDAEAILQDVLELCSHPDSSGRAENCEYTAAHALGVLFFKAGEPERAETWLRRAISEWPAKDRDPNLTVAVNQLAQTLTKQGRPEDAKQVALAHAERRRRSLGDEHWDTLQALSNAASILGTIGHPEEAEPLRREILEINLRVRGPDDRKTLTAMNNLAWCVAYQGRIAEAEEIHREIIEVATRALGTDDSRTLWSVYSMGCLAAMRGDRDTAIEWLTRAVDEGFANAGDMRTSSDLDSVRGDPEFEQLVLRASDNGKVGKEG